MLNKNISRRQALKAITKIGGLTIIGVTAPALAVLDVSKKSESTESLEQVNSSILFVEEVVSRNLQKSDKIYQPDISLFAKDFVSLQGTSFDYNKRYSGIVGEFTLSRYYLLSTNLKQAPHTDSSDSVRYIGLNSDIITD